VRRLLPVLVLTAACTARRPPSPPRAPIDAPDHFLVVVLDASGTETTSEPPGNPACRSPLQDPDGTRLTLARSSGGEGDYVVEEGRYGVRTGELLRVDCATGRPLAIVPR
jgi:hypothetical protein